MGQDVLLKKENFNAIDIAKFILAFFVIVRHTCYDFFDNPVLSAAFDSVIIRLAVPFFFVSSGFFFFRDIIFENGKIKKCPENKTKLFRFLKRTFSLYLIWAIIYIVWEAFTYIKSGLSLLMLLKSYFFSFFLSGFAGSFWYIVFLFYATILLYILLRIFRVEIVAVIATFFFAVFLYGYTYRHVFDTDFLSVLISPLMSVSVKPLGLSFSLYLLYDALGFIFAGLLCVRIKNRLNLKSSGILALVSLALAITENILIRTVLAYNGYLYYTVFLVPTVFFGIMFLSKINLKGKPKVFTFFRNCSSFIYCFHALALMIFNYFTDNRLSGTIAIFLTISAISVIVAFTIVPLSNKLKFLKKLY